MAEVKSYKVLSLPSNPTPDSIYWVKGSSASDVIGYITDRNGVPYPLKDLQGTSGITGLTNTDGNLVITGADNKVINLAPALLSVINSALQSGDNISELLNDAGYITSADLPTKTSELINDGSNATSTYVETDELGVTAFSNDYNDLDNKPTIPTPISNHSELSLDDGTNPHGTTKGDVGLGNVDNTSDVYKPISTATQNALDSKLDKVSTAGVERAYIINADGSQGTKATSEWVNTNNYRQWLVKDTTPTTAVTGTTSLTQIGSSILIPANTFSSEDVMILDSFACQKTAGLGTCVLAIWCNTANTLTGATVILAHSMAVNTISGKVIKTFEITGGLMNARVNGPSGAFTDIGNVLLTPLSITFNPTIDNYFFTTVTLSNASDSVTRRQLLISK